MISLLPFLLLLINNVDKLEAFGAEGKMLIDEIAPGFLPMLLAKMTPPPEMFSVSWLQAGLNKAIGANLDVDGDYGDATRASVVAYQTARGLDVNGWAGTLIATLYSEVGASP